MVSPPHADLRPERGERQASLLRGEPVRSLEALAYPGDPVGHTVQLVAAGLAALGELRQLRPGTAERTLLVAKGLELREQWGGGVLVVQPCDAVSETCLFPRDLRQPPVDGPEVDLNPLVTPEALDLPADNLRLQQDLHNPLPHRSIELLGANCVPRAPVGIVAMSP